MTSSGSSAPDTRGGVVLGLIFIALGGIFLLDRFTGIDVAAAGWPLFVIVPGLLVLAWGVSMSGREGLDLAIGGGIVLVVGLILAVQNATGLWATWAYAWALVGPGGPGVGMIAFGATHGDRGLVRNGVRTLATGIVLFVGFGLFFEGVIGLSGPPFLTSDAGPVALIVLGVIVLVAAVVRGREPER